MLRVWFFLCQLLWLMCIDKSFSPYVVSRLPLKTNLMERMTAQQISGLNPHSSIRRPCNWLWGFESMLHSLGTWLAAYMGAKASMEQCTLLVRRLSQKGLIYTGTYLGLYKLGARGKRQIQWEDTEWMKNEQTNKQTNKQTNTYRTRTNDSRFNN